MYQSRSVSYSQSSGISMSLESVLGGPQDKGRGSGGNAAQRADPRRLMQSNLIQDPRRFSDAIVTPPARPPTPQLQMHQLTKHWLQIRQTPDDDPGSETRKPSGLGPSNSSTATVPVPTTAAVFSE